MVSASMVSSSSVCTKCGTSKKSGKRSCCAHGGAWFENCGDAGNTKFDHTWTEGIRACKDLVTSASVKSSLQTIMLHRVGVIDHPLNILQLQNATQQQTNISQLATFETSSMPDVVSTDSEDSVRITKAVVCMVFLIYHFSTVDVVELCRHDELIEMK